MSALTNIFTFAPISRRRQIVSQAVFYHCSLNWRGWLLKKKALTWASKLPKHVRLLPSVHLLVHRTTQVNGLKKLQS